MIKTPAPSVQFKQVLPPFVTEMFPVYMPMSTSDGHTSVPATLKKVKLHVRTTSKNNYKEQKPVQISNTAKILRIGRLTMITNSTQLNSTQFYLQII